MVLKSCQNVDKSANPVTLFQVVNGTDLESLSEDARALIKSLKGDTPLMKMDEVWRELQVCILAPNAR